MMLHGRRYREYNAIEMNTVEPVNLKELEHTDYESLIKFRIRKILMICSHYDAFILEEDGQIDVQIYREYIELNLSSST